MALLSKARAALPHYEETLRVCALKLEHLLHDIGATSEEQLAEVDKAIAAAENAWLSQVQFATDRQLRLQEQVQEALSEIKFLREEVGDLSVSGEEQPPHATTREQLTRVTETLAAWRTRRSERMAQYEAIMCVNRALRAIMGLQVPEPKPDLTLSGLEYLKLEQERLKAERERRSTRMDEDIAALVAQCSELGEDPKCIVGEVHHALVPRVRVTPEDTILGGGIPAVTLTVAAASASASTPSPSTTETELNSLSDEMFTRIAAQAEVLRRKKADREQQLQSLRDVLESLWEVVGAEASDKAALGQTMAAPTRLHMRNLDKVAAEVRRLEECRAQAMRDLALSKARELQAAYASTHLPAPDLQSLLSDLNRGISAGGASPLANAGLSGGIPGQISECLGRVVRALTELAPIIERRAPLVSAIDEVNHARAECAWLKTYENDEGRYKGRDANAKLQRSIRAQKLRDALPTIVAGLAQRLEEWELAEGSPFMYDGKEYTEVLQKVQAEVVKEQEAAAAKGSRRQKTSGGGAAVSTAAGAGAAAAAASKAALMGCTTPASKTPLPNVRSSMPNHPTASLSPGLLKSGASVVLPSSTTTPSARRPTSGAAAANPTMSARGAHSARSAAGAAAITGAARTTTTASSTSTTAAAASAHMHTPPPQGRAASHTAAAAAQAASPAPTVTPPAGRVSARTAQQGDDAHDASSKVQQQRTPGPTTPASVTPTSKGATITPPSRGMGAKSKPSADPKRSEAKHEVEPPLVAEASSISLGGMADDAVKVVDQALKDLALAKSPVAAKTPAAAGISSRIPRFTVQ